MDFSIMSRKEAIDFTYSFNHRPNVVISITDVGSSKPQFGRIANIYYMLRLEFDDVLHNEPNAMTSSQANDIVQLIKVLKNSAVGIDNINFIVHCEGGVSRSAGICAALKTILGKDDTDIFRNPKYAPNRHCYYTLLNTYFGSFPEQEHKFVENIEAYRKAEGLDDEQ